MRWGFGEREWGYGSLWRGLGGAMLPNFLLRHEIEKI